MSKGVIHAAGEQEHALCGMAFDAYETGDADAPIVFAEPGQKVTCEFCCRVVDFVQSHYDRLYRYFPPAKAKGKK